jgi:hypothetical protein
MYEPRNRDQENQSEGCVRRHKDWATIGYHAGANQKNRNWEKDEKIPLD